MDCPLSQLDLYTPPNEYHIFYASYKSSQQTKPKLELIFLVYHVSLTLLASSVFRKLTPQSQPRFNIVSCCQASYNLLAFIWVNRSLDKVGSPFNWLTSVFLKILDSPLPLHYSTVDWEGIPTFSCSSIRTSKAFRSSLCNFTSSCESFSTYNASIPSLW